MKVAMAGWTEAALALVTGGAGAFIFWLVGFPMPFLTGPAVAVTLAAVLGLQVSIPAALRNVCFLVLGLNIGGSVTPEVLATAAHWPGSLAVLCLMLPAGMALGSLLLNKGFGFNHSAALLASTPGHLSFVLSMSLERSLPIEPIAVVQSVRVLLLTIFLPIPLVLFTDVSDMVLPMRVTIGWGHFAVILGLAALVGMAFLRLKVPAALLLAGMLVSAIGHASDLTPGFQHAALTTAAFIVMGSMIGTRFSGIALGDLKRSLLAGVCLTLLVTMLALLCAVAMALAGGYDLSLLFLSYAPGGVEAMAAMAVQLHLAPAVVAAHHVLRLLVLTVLVPLMLARATARDAAA